MLTSRQDLWAAAKNPAQLVRHLADRGHPRSTDVQRSHSCREPGVKSRDHRSCHVGDVDEVAALAAVLEDMRWFATQQAVVKIDATPAYGVSRGIPWP